MKKPKKVKDDSTKLLTPREVLFAQAYAGSQSIKEAAERVGLTPGQGSRIAKKPNVRRYVRVMLQERAAALGITRDRILIGLHREATDFSERASHSARVSAWTALGKTQQMFTDKVEVSGQLDGTTNVRIFLPHNGREDDMEIAEFEEKEDA